jgi:hypothetical protein
MLGDADFDRRVVNEIVRPWLMSQFDLPDDLQKDPTCQHVLRIAAFIAEKAKIELSAQPTTRISADESQLSSRDEAKESTSTFPSTDRNSKLWSSIRSNVRSTPAGICSGRTATSPAISIASCSSAA